jgi:hypothetical protein
MRKTTVLERPSEETIPDIEHDPPPSLSIRSPTLVQENYPQPTQSQSKTHLSVSVRKGKAPAKSNSNVDQLLSSPLPINEGKLPMASSSTEGQSPATFTTPEEMDSNNTKAARRPAESILKTRFDESVKDPVREVPLSGQPSKTETEELEKKPLPRENSQIRLLDWAVGKVIPLTSPRDLPGKEILWFDSTKKRYRASPKSWFDWSPLQNDNIKLSTKTGIKGTTSLLHEPVFSLTSLKLSPVFSLSCLAGKEIGSELQMVM